MNLKLLINIESLVNFLLKNKYKWNSEINNDNQKRFKFKILFFFNFNKNKFILSFIFFTFYFIFFLNKSIFKNYVFCNL